jgi:hypothetical protein
VLNRLLWILLTILIVGCQGSRSTRAGSVAGAVLDALWNKPLGGASVELIRCDQEVGLVASARWRWERAEVVQAGEDAKFVRSGLSPGFYLARPAYSNYQRDSLRFEVRAGRATKDVCRMHRPESYHVSEESHPGPAGNPPAASTLRPEERLAVPPDSTDAPEVVIQNLTIWKPPPTYPTCCPALSVCGAIVDALTDKPVLNARVDCSEGDLSSGCNAISDTRGYFVVAVCKEPMVFTAADYDTLRIEDWRKIEQPCEKRTRSCGAFELRDIVLTPSRHSSDVKR